MQNLIKIWKNKNKILEGIKNSIFTSNHIEEIANERNQICQSCPFIDKKGDLCIMPGTQPCCNLCGCSLHLKQRSLSSSCDDKRWDAILSQDEDDNLNNNLNPI